MNYTIDLPAFPGFYDSFLYTPDMESEAVESAMEYAPLSSIFPRPLCSTILNKSELYTFDFESYKKAVAEKYADAVANTLERAIYRAPVCSFVIVNPLHVISPREYNFYTDRVECEIKIDAGDVLYYLEHNRAEYDKYLTDKFTSRSGFISFYSPSDPAFYDIESWYDDTVFLSAALDFIVRNELGDDAEYKLSNDALGEINMDEYIALHESLQDFMESDEAEYYIREYKRLEDQARAYVSIMGDKYYQEARAGLENVTEELGAEIVSKINQKMRRNIA